MGEEKPDTLDFVKDFQEYLSQQTQHVNMISGSVSGVKEVDDVPAGNCKTLLYMQAGLSLINIFLPSFPFCLTTKSHVKHVTPRQNSP
jgi:hypothetical protein